MNETTNSHPAGHRWIGIGAIFGFLSVGMGAFGAHGLQDYLQEMSTTDPDLAVKRLANWNTAAQYQMYHAIAIVITGLIMLQTSLASTKLLSAAASCFTVGTLVFSGLLYSLVLLEMPILGAIVPIGGVSFMVGWILLTIAAFSLSRRNFGRQN
jgi:uncharacterized membrane protein YgdD (TMEM256/DUF423 family)